MYLRARYYNPGLGRFTSEDPAKDGLNWYVYCNGNPIRFEDSSGKCYYDKNGNWCHDSWEYRDGYERKNDLRKKTVVYGNMKLSSKGLKFIADYEAFSAIPYVGLDKQNTTIGYGHVIGAGENYANGITQEQAINLLKSDMSRYEGYVNNFLKKNKITLTQNEFDALVSFAYNAGIAWIVKEETADLKNLLTSGNYTDEDIKKEMLTWIYVNGEESEGLYRRRMDEAQVFTLAEYNREYPKMPK